MSAATILTLANGLGIDLRAPLLADIVFSAVAEQLAKEARFNGATPGVFYSVAQHQVHAADCAETAIVDGYHWDDVKQGRVTAAELALLPAYLLSHDDHEFTLKNWTTPLKCTIAEEIEAQCGVLAPAILKCFDSITERHDVAIYAAALLPWPVSAGLRRLINHWDKRLFVTEWLDFMPGVPHPNWAPYAGIEPLGGALRPWDWPAARDALFARMQALLPVFHGVAV